MNVDAWDMGTWRDEFNKHEVLVMTHQILLNNILHGYIRPSNINLLILDECHHTGKNHPYKRIMSKLEESVNRPRVMGLTASIINEKVRKRGALLQHYLEERMRTLEANLRAVCFTCADQASILPYATKPEESIEEHRPLYYDSDPEINAVSQLMQGAFGDVIPGKLMQVTMDYASYWFSESRQNPVHLLSIVVQNAIYSNTDKSCCKKPLFNE